MENASKALLIAGAILIVILLIAVGMLVYSKSRDVIDAGVTQMSSAEIQMFNAQFTNYEGIQNETSTKLLIQTILNNNLNYERVNAEDISRYVDVMLYTKYYSGGTTHYGGWYSNNLDDEDVASTIKEMYNYVSDNTGSNKYRIKLEYSEIGLVNLITISQEGAHEY